MTIYEPPKPQETAYFPDSYHIGDICIIVDYDEKAVWMKRLVSIERRHEHLHAADWNVERALTFWN